MRPFVPPTIRNNEEHDVLVFGEPAISMLAIVFQHPELVAPTFGMTNLIVPKGARFHPDHGIVIDDSTLPAVHPETMWTGRPGMTYKQLRRRAWSLDGVPCLCPSDLLNVQALDAANRIPGGAEGLIRLVIIVGAESFKVTPWPEAIEAIDALGTDTGTFARLAEWSNRDYLVSFVAARRALGSLINMEGSPS